MTFPNPVLAARSGTTLPQIGAGTWQIPDPDADQVVLAALRAGYRLIDTAAGYGNETGVGRGIAETDVARADIVVTTKLHEAVHDYDDVRRAADESVSKLRLDQVDLYLIHWPKPQVGKFVETWRALISLQQDGLAREIGVCNFTREHLERIVGETGVIPALNQIELHPALPQDSLREYHAELGIITQAWSPLASGQLLKDPVIGRIGARLDRSPAQVILRWHIEKGNAVIPKSTNPQRLETNLELFDFALETDDLAAMDGLATGIRTGPDPDQY